MNLDRIKEIDNEVEEMNRKIQSLKLEKSMLSESFMKNINFGQKPLSEIIEFF